jgi:hypothetical protein
VTDQQTETLIAAFVGGKRLVDAARAAGLTTGAARHRLGRARLSREIPTSRDRSEQNQREVERRAALGEDVPAIAHALGMSRENVRWRLRGRVARELRPPRRAFDPLEAMRRIAAGQSVDAIEREMQLSSEERGRLPELRQKLIREGARALGIAVDEVAP